MGRRVTIMAILTSRYDAAKKELTIVLKVNEAGSPSVSGKTLVLSSTHGNQPLGINIDGKAVIAGVNVYVRK
jgi:hypothetical protein